jgi:hypothetical protein
MLLSRPGRKDLAQDYSAADLGRQAAQAEVGERQASALRRQEQALKADLGTLDRAEAAKNHHRRTEIALQQAVRRVYAHPEEADPKAFDRLAPGGAAAYGELRGQGRFFGKDAARISAERGLRPAIWTHREAEGSLRSQQAAVARVQGDPTEIKVQLDRVTAAVRRSSVTRSTVCGPRSSPRWEAARDRLQAGGRGGRPGRGKKDHEEGHILVALPPGAASDGRASALPSARPLPNRRLDP